MTQRLAILCSGQGGQGAAMLPLLQSDAVAWQCWQSLEQGWRLEAESAGGMISGGSAASDNLPQTLDDATNSSPLVRTASAPQATYISTNIPAWSDLLHTDARFQNAYAQVLVVAFGLAAWQALQPVLPQPALVAGYSVGEMTALAVAGALEPPAVLRLTQQRAMLMDAAASAAASATANAAEGALGSAAGSGFGSATTCLVQHSSDEPRDQGLLALTGTPWRPLAAHILAAGAFIAIDNGEQSCVLGGYRHVLASLAPYLRAHGGQTQEVAVSVAAHTPLLVSAAAPFLQLLQQQTWQRASCPALAALDARRLIRFDTGCVSMAQALHDTIHWADAMDALAEGGIGVALELGPGSSLTHMLQQRHPGIACRSLADFRSLQAAREWLERQLAA